MGWLSIVTVVQDGWCGFDFLQEQEIVLFSLNVQTACGTHPATCSMDAKSKTATSLSWPFSGSLQRNEAQNAHL